MAVRIARLESALFEFPLGPGGGGFKERGDDARAARLIEMAREIALEGGAARLSMLDPAGRGKLAKPFDWAGDLLARSALMFSNDSGGGFSWPSYGRHTRHGLKVIAGVGSLAGAAASIPAVTLAALPAARYLRQEDARREGWLPPSKPGELHHLMCQSLSRSLYDGLSDEEDFLAVLDLLLPARSLAPLSAEIALAELMEATGQIREPSHTRALSLPGLDRAFAIFKKAAPGVRPDGVLRELNQLEGAPSRNAGLPASQNALALSLVERWAASEACSPPSEASPGRSSRL